MKTTKKIGIDVPNPKKECNDKKCPFHGDILPRGRTFVGTIIKKDLHNTATVEWTYKKKMPKYERSQVIRTKIRVHNPECVEAGVGDSVKIMQTRPLSKTKNFVVVQKLGKEKGFVEKMRAREESKYKERDEREEDVKVDFIKDKEKEEMKSGESEEVAEDKIEEDAKESQDKKSKVDDNKEDKEKVE